WGRPRTASFGALGTELTGCFGAMNSAPWMSVRGRELTIDVDFCRPQAAPRLATRKLTIKDVLSFSLHPTGR
ncbi:MAG: hypothetical protein ABI702_07755, partial [Burkholderiales bacterium]